MLDTSINNAAGTVAASITGNRSVLVIIMIIYLLLSLSLSSSPIG